MLGTCRGVEWLTVRTSSRGREQMWWEQGVVEWCHTYTPTEAAGNNTDTAQMHVTTCLVLQREREGEREGGEREERERGREGERGRRRERKERQDRKSTRLNSSH